MANKKVQEQVEKGELIIAVDATRAADDPHKLLAYMLALVIARLADLRLKDLATFTTESDRAAASGKIRAALDELRALLGDGYNFIQGLPRSDISAPDRLGLYTSYGWESGEIGDFDDARIESMANLAIAVTPTIPTVAFRYRADLIAAITAQLLILNTNQTIAAGGTVAATDARDLALDLMEAITERVRHHYCGASDLRAKNPELARIGFRVTHDAGEVTPSGTGPIAGTPVYDTVQMKVTIQEMPERAVFIRSIRQAVGGAPEPAGVSNTTSVSVVQFSPLVPGTTYEFWVVGVNEDAEEGPESEHVTHVEPVGP